MIKSLSKKAEKINNEELKKFTENGFYPLSEAVRFGARMMLQVAIEEELTAFLERDYYVRRKGNGKRNGYKPKTVKIRKWSVQIPMPQTRDTEGPFHSRILPPYVTQADKI